MDWFRDLSIFQFKIILAFKEFYTSYIASFYAIIQQRVKDWLPTNIFKTSFFETIQQAPSVIILDDKINVFTHVYILHLPLLEICPLG